MDDRIQNILDSIIEYSPKIVMAIVILIVGLWLIKKLMEFLEKIMVTSNLNEDLVPFLKSMASVLLKVLLLFSVAELVGIKTTSFVALLAAAGFAIGMALQGSLGNFASGVMVLIFKPYKTGDLIEIEDTAGWVQEIQIFNTILKTVRNKTVIIPNSLATAGKITNHSTNGYIRLDLFNSIPYEEDFNKVEQAILAEVSSIEGVLKEPKPIVGIEEFESHNIKIGTFLFVEPENYWTVYYAAHKAIKKGLGKNQIKMAYSEGIELGAIGVN